MKPVTAIIVGAGHRAAEVYASYSLKHPDKLKIVGVAEPIEHRRSYAAKKYGIKPSMCFKNADELAAKGVNGGRKVRRAAAQ